MHDLRVHIGAIALQVREYEHPGSPIVFLHYGEEVIRTILIG